MDVRCPQCQTLYELEERQLSSGAVTLKCSRCQHVFRFESGSRPVEENQRRWMINSSRDGAILYLNDFTDLHRWIMEKKVRRDDKISRTGDKWSTIGSIPEFAPIFIVVESISDLTGSPEDSHIATRVREGTPASGAGQAAPSSSPDDASAPRAEKAPSKQSPERPRVKTEVQFPDASGSMPVADAPQRTPSSEEQTRRERPRRPSRPTPGDLPPRPGGKPPVETGERTAPATSSPAGKPEPNASDTLEDDWSIGDTGQPGRVDKVSAEFPVATSSRSRAPMIALVLLLGLGGGAAALYFARPDLVEEFVPGLAQSDAVVALGETTSDAQPDAASIVEGTDDIDVDARIDNAYSAAFEAQSRREAELFEGAIFAIHQPLGQAVELATSTASKAAEGGLTDEKLADARSALERGRLSRAENLFEEVLEFEPRNANAIAGLGFIYLEKSNASRAATQFRRAIDLGGGDGSAFIGLGTAERQLDNPQAAYDAYDLYLGRFPRGEKASIARYQLEQLKKQLGM